MKLQATDKCPVVGRTLLQHSMLKKHVSQLTSGMLFHRLGDDLHS